LIFIKSIISIKDMFENTKAAFLRRSNNRLFTGVFKGDGLHIGPGNDPLKKHHYPLCESITLVSVPEYTIENDTLKHQLSDKQFDFVYATSLGVYEDEPKDVINHWLSFVKSKGHLILTIPDEDLYEQGYFPSIFNNSHKKTFSIYKHQSWSGKHYNIIDLVLELDSTTCRKIELVDSNYDYSLYGKQVDQTYSFSDGVEACIEVILKKF
jgi:SAM-dependent methyltransferase